MRWYQLVTIRPVWIPKREQMDNADSDDDKTTQDSQNESNDQSEDQSRHESVILEQQIQEILSWRPNKQYQNKRGDKGERGGDGGAQSNGCVAASESFVAVASSVKTVATLAEIVGWPTDLDTLFDIEWSGTSAYNIETMHSNARTQ